MKESVQKKGNRITLQIILFFVALATISFFAQAINEVLLGMKVGEAKTRSLPEVLTQKNTSGAVVKLNTYAIDIKHRINALPDPNEKEDVHIMVPIRPIGQDADEEAVALFVLEEHAYNCVENALDAWKDSLINLRVGEEMYVEILGLDELPGNVPKVIRANERVAKKVLVFREINYNKMEYILFFITGVFMLVCYYFYRRLRKTAETKNFRSI
jgi:hypothetical protein